MRARTTLRLAGPADARAIGELVRRGTRRDVLPDQSPAAGAYLLTTMTARAERERIGNGYRYYVAEVGGRLAGVAAMRDDAHLYRLFVSARFQRRGIGRMLWLKALADCRKRLGARAVTVNASACAVPVYRRLGFVATGPAQAKGPGVVTTPMVFRVGASSQTA